MPHGDLFARATALRDGREVPGLQEYAEQDSDNLPASTNATVEQPTLQLTRVADPHTVRRQDAAATHHRAFAATSTIRVTFTSELDLFVGIRGPSWVVC